MFTTSPADCSALILPDLHQLAIQTDLICRKSSKFTADGFLQSLLSSVVTGQGTMGTMVPDTCQTPIKSPEAHQRRLRTSNACENVNGQIKKRTKVVGLFPSEELLLRLGILVEISETWETTKSYLKLS